jgi:hypothetical protein
MSTSQSNAASIPQLEPHCGSWIVTSPQNVVRELFERANVERAVAAGWKVETTLQWLARLNRQERA